MEQRLLALSQATCRSGPLLLVDELTAGLEDEEAERVVSALRRYATTRAILFATHNMRDARALGGTVALLAGGRVLETSAAASFFHEPETPSGRQFVLTGGCPAPSPAAERASLASDFPPPAPLSERAVTALRAKTVPTAPMGFHWLVPGKLGGLPRPGLLADLDEDLDKLTAVGVNTLVTLEETRTVDADALRRRRIQSVFFPIADMGAPDVTQALLLCQYLDTLLRGAAVVGVHCRAGLGRTGMVLVAHDIWMGTSAVTALDRARKINPRWVQSKRQLDLLRDLEVAVRSERGAVSQ